MTAVALSDDQLRQVMTIAESIPHDLRGIYLEHIAADLCRRCDRDGTIGDGDVFRAAIAARAVVLPKARVRGELNDGGLDRTSSRRYVTERDQA
jgi:hypothetical protein